MIEVDVNQILDKFKALEGKNQKKAYKSALRKATNILVKEARNNLKSAVDATSTPSSRKQFKGKKLLNGIVVKIAKDVSSAKVNILSDMRLVWFENGTNDRNTGQQINKKGHETGSIEENNFFTNARNSTESQVFSELENILMTSIEKTWNKQNK